MKYVAVVSSTVSEVGYDPSTQTLGVRFKSGGEYHYARVPEQVYKGLITASSVGRYLDHNVKKAGYLHTRIS